MNLASFFDFSVEGCLARRALFIAAVPRWSARPPSARRARRGAGGAARGPVGGQCPEALADASAAL